MCIFDNSDKIGSIFYCQKTEHSVLKPQKSSKKNFFITKTHIILFARDRLMSISFFYRMEYVNHENVIKRWKTWMK